VGNTSSLPPNKYVTVWIILYSNIIVKKLNIIFSNWLVIFFLRRRLKRFGLVNFNCLLVFCEITLYTMVIEKKKLVWYLPKSIWSETRRVIICNGRPRQTIHYNTCSQSTLSVQVLFTHYIKKKNKKHTQTK